MANRRGQFSSNGSGITNDNTGPYTRFPQQQPNVPLLPMNQSVPQYAQPIGQETAEGGVGTPVPGNRFSSLMIMAGFLAFFLVLVLAGLFAWRSFTQEDSINSLSQRLSMAESLLSNHTTRLNILDVELAATNLKVGINMMDIAANNATLNDHEDRITSLENRTALLEDRMTDAEIKLIGLMDNVTTLQQEMLQAQQDIITLFGDVLAINNTVNNHETRIQALEVNIAANNEKLQNLMAWLQGNLTIIDQRLDILNVTYVVTASGTAEVRSGVAIPANVTWETRRFTDVGLDFEYLWISDSDWNPTMIRLEPPNSTWSFEITNFTLTSTPGPVMSVPQPTLILDRPLMTYQQSKFLIQNEIIEPNPAILAARWNNERVSLQFITNLHEFSSVTITKALTFIIGFM